MSNQDQNLLENWDGTRHLLDVSWRYGLKNIFFRNKTFLFFKIESWNFQVQFEIKIRETSQNFNSFSLFRQLLFSSFFYRLSDWVEILQGFTKFNFKLNLKVSAFYLEKQKSFIPKKKIFLAIVNIKTKNLCLLTQFSRRFWGESPFKLERFVLQNTTSGRKKLLVFFSFNGMSQSGNEKLCLHPW